MTPWRTLSQPLPSRSRLRLQCGHGHDTVENVQSGVTYNRGDRLQCGHGHDTVENSSAPGRSPGGLTWLQCGHGHDTVENCGRPNPQSFHELDCLPRAAPSVLAFPAAHVFCCSHNSLSL